MRTVYLGTSEFAATVLRRLAGSPHRPALVVTPPDRRQGRGRKVQPPPAAVAAQELGLDLLQAENVNEEAALERIRAAKPEAVAVCAFGQLIREPLLSEWPLLNVHPSLLPRWRGAAPIQRAILAGDSETGVCLMQMEKGLDAGPVLLSARTPIGPGDTGGSLHDRLAAQGAQVLAEGLHRVSKGKTLAATPQSGEGVTYAHKLDKAEAKLDFASGAIELERKVRAFDPWPVAEAELAGERIRVWAAEARASEPGTPDSAKPGEIVAVSKHGIDLACGTGVLRIFKLQRAGGRVISAADYLNARPGLR